MWNMPRMAQLAPNTNSIVLRPSVEQANIGALRDAFGKMQALKAADNRSWIYSAEYHGFGPTTAGTTQALVRRQAAIIHTTYSFPGIEPICSTSNTLCAIRTRKPFRHGGIGRQPPRMRKAYRSPTPNRRSAGPRTRSRAGRCPRPQGRRQTNHSLAQFLSLTSYVDFSIQLQNIHDAVHGWMGGQMGIIATAASGRGVLAC